MNGRRAEARSLAALMAGAACIGFAPIWVRWSEVGAVATAFHRVALALPFAWIWAQSQRPTVGTTGAPWSRRERMWAAAAGVCFAVDLAAWHWSIGLTTVANATLLANFAPVFVTLGAWLILRERASVGFLVGMLIALGGAALLLGASVSISRQHVRGDLLGLVTALFYGGYQLCIARLRRQRNAGLVLFWSGACCAPCLWAMAVLGGERLVPETGRGWAVLAGLALTAQVAGQGLITYGFAHLPASFSSLTLLVQPLVATLAGWWLLGETMGLRQGMGGLLLLTGLVVARSGPVHRARPPAA